MANRTDASRGVALTMDMDAEALAKWNDAFGKLNQFLSVVRASVEGIVSTAIPEGLMAVGARIKEAAAAVAYALGGSVANALAQLRGTSGDSLRNAVPKGPATGYSVAASPAMTSAFATTSTDANRVRDSDYTEATTSTPAASVGGIGNAASDVLGGLRVLAGGLASIARASGSALHGVLQFGDVVAGVVGKANPALPQTFMDIVKNMPRVLDSALVSVFTMVNDLAHTTAAAVAGCVGQITQIGGTVRQWMSHSEMGPDAARDTVAARSSGTSLPKNGGGRSVYFVQNALAAAYGRDVPSFGPDVRTTSSTDEMNRKLGEVQTELAQFFENLPVILQEAFAKNFPDHGNVSSVPVTFPSATVVAGTAVSPCARTVADILSNTSALPVSGIVAMRETQ